MRVAGVGLRMPMCGVGSPGRVQDHGGDRDTPDSFVPSSSPESVVGVEVRRYPDLASVKEEPPEPVPSPIIPILPSTVGRGRGAWPWWVFGGS